MWELEEVVRNYTKAEIYLEAAWADIDYMDQYKVSESPVQLSSLDHHPFFPHLIHAAS